MKKLILSCGFLFLLLPFLYSQPAQGNPGGSPTPIDGGLVVLLAAGAALGGKYYHARNKKTLGVNQSHERCRSVFSFSSFIGACNFFMNFFHFP